MGCLIKIACAITVALGLSIHSQADQDTRSHPTAEELLKAFQRQRPTNKVIPPASASDRGGPSYSLPFKGGRQGGGALLPEGRALVSRSGRLVHEGRWWTFVFDPAEGEPPTTLLPNASLEVMVRTASGSASPVKFVVSGEITVFEGADYLLVRMVRRSVVADEPSAPQEETVPGENTSGEEEAPASEEARQAVSSDLPAEDVLAKLKAQRPKQEMIPVDQSVSDDRADRGTTGARAMIPDGSPLMSRPGRLVRDGEWWSFAFESDRPDHPEPPMKLLPSNSVELMLQAARRGANGLVFLVSGEVTAFQGDNFLLPRVAVQRIATDNLRK